MNTEIIPRQRKVVSGNKPQKRIFRNLLDTLLVKDNIIFIPLSFLLGRASLVTGLMPFGIALYASTIDMEINRLLVALSIVLGMISQGAREQVYITLASMLIFNAMNIPFKKNNSRLNFKFSIIAFVSVLVPEFVLTALQGFLTYDLLKSILHGFIVFTLMFIFRNALGIINFSNKKHAVSNEEIISVAIISALALSGLSNLNFYDFSLKNILSIIAILLFSYKCGPGVGAAAGVTIGLIVSMSTSLAPVVIGTYAFCGLLSGVFKNLGKIGSGLGFVMGNTVLTLYLGNPSEIMIYIKEIIAAVAIFLIMPQKVIEMPALIFKKNMDSFIDKKSYSLRIKEITVEKLKKFSRSFQELSKTLSAILSNITDISCLSAATCV